MVKWWKKMQWQPWCIKLTHWEYWSFNTVYLPIIWYWVYLAIRARSFFFFNASNPSIENGGFLMESKWDIYPLLPPEFTPKTAIVRKEHSPEQALAAASAFCFPVICKPDLGSRGRGVAIIQNSAQLLAYQQQCPLDFLVQEKINYPLEAGIFYVRMPEQKSGTVTGIVEKEFLSITGNGQSTIRQLLMQNKRFVLQLEAIKSMIGNDLDIILPKNETRQLMPFGNHARGCKFYNSHHRITPALVQAVDAVCTQINGFYYGRMDIRFESWEKLEKMECFSIIELNGAGSEPTHMYGCKTIFGAWKEIMEHWHRLYKVSSANHKKGMAYLTYKESKEMIEQNKHCDKVLMNFQFSDKN